MKIIGILPALLVLVVASSGVGHALTVDEIVKLKQAGVADSTIELMIKRSGDARSAGVWKQDGWIVYSTESKFPVSERVLSHSQSYPVTIHPRVFTGRRHRAR